jgi:hypothetical protein
VEGDWRYTLDPTYRGYLEQLDRLGLLQRSAGYIVHNPFELYTPNGATGETIHTELIDDWTSGGYMPGMFFYDHEVATCWRGATKITCTPYNLVKSLTENTLNTYRKFKRMVGIYSARWFINSNGPQEHTTYFDNINRPETGTQRPLWWAWYPQTFSSEYGNLEDSLSDLLVPTSEQVAKFLQCGSYSLGALWQFTAGLKLAGDATGVDASVSLVSKAELWSMLGLPADGAPPAETPSASPSPSPSQPAEEEPGDLAEVLARLSALAAQHAAIAQELAALRDGQAAILQQVQAPRKITLSGKSEQE